MSAAIARSILRALNGNAENVVTVLNWHAEHPGLLSTNLLHALMFIKNNISPFDVSCAKVKAELRMLMAAQQAANKRNPFSREEHLAQQEAAQEHQAKVASLTMLVNTLESNQQEIESNQAAITSNQERINIAHATQLEGHRLALANQVVGKQLEQLATKEDLEHMLQQHSSKRARSATASPPTSEAEEEAPTAKAPPTYEELQAKLAEYEAGKANNKDSSDKAKKRQWKKAKPDSKQEGKASGSNRAPEGSAEEAKRQAEYHRRKAQEAEEAFKARK